MYHSIIVILYDWFDISYFSKHSFTYSKDNHANTCYVWPMFKVWVHNCEKRLWTVYIWENPNYLIVRNLLCSNANNTWTNEILMLECTYACRRINMFDHQEIFIYNLLLLLSIEPLYATLSKCIGHDQLLLLHLVYYHV